MLDGDAANKPAATPVPAKGTVVVVESFLGPPPLVLPLTVDPDVIEICPVTVPVD
jgi:hypothetical protein